MYPSNSRLNHSPTSYSYLGSENSTRSTPVTKAATPRIVAKRTFKVVWPGRIPGRGRASCNTSNYRKTSPVIVLEKVKREDVKREEAALNAALKAVWDADVKTWDPLAAFLPGLATGSQGDSAFHAGDTYAVSARSCPETGPFNEVPGTSRGGLSDAEPFANSYVEQCFAGWQQLTKPLHLVMKDQLLEKKFGDLKCSPNTWKDRVVALGKFLSFLEGKDTDYEALQNLEGTIHAFTKSPYMVQIIRLAFCSFDEKFFKIFNTSRRKEERLKEPEHLTIMGKLRQKGMQRPSDTVRAAALAGFLYYLEENKAVCTPRLNIEGTIEAYGKHQPTIALIKGGLRAAGLLATQER